MTNKELYQATFSQVHGEVRQADFPRRKRRSPRTFAALAAAIMLAAALSATAVAEDWFGLRQAALPQGDAGSGVEEARRSSPSRAGLGARSIRPPRTGRIF